MEKATLGGGCFWCTEAIFQRLKGVQSVIPGYGGGRVENPSYREVTYGDTGHAETIQITFDPKIISYEKLLEVFFKLHDPTTLNKQGDDVGTQYRSVIFFHNNKQKKLAQKAKELAQKDYSDPIVTEITEYKNFYEAENYHQNYFNNNRSAPYCRVVIDPKVDKLFSDFKDITSTK
jgi:peptide-methionine (S)-S-oxide reductase